MLRSIAKGIAAGAAGTVALNVTTYLDMAVRGRGASSTPEDTAGVLADKVGLSLSSEGPDSATARNRRSGIGALMGLATGLGVGAAYGALRSAVSAPPRPVAALGLAAVATAGSAAPMTLLGITDPREWDAVSWAMDIVPHVAYGAVTAAVHDDLLSARGDGR